MFLGEYGPWQATDECIELGYMSLHAQGLEFGCIGLSDIGQRKSLFQMRDKLRIDLDGKEPRALATAV